MNGTNKRSTTFAIVAMLVIATCNESLAATIGSYSFTGAGNFNPSDTGVGRSLSTFTAGSGLGGPGVVSNQHSSYLWTEGNLSAAQTNNDYVSLTITPDAGYYVSLSDVQFKHTRGQNLGPTTLALLVNNTQVGIDIPTLHNTQVTATRSLGLTNQTSAITARIYGWGGSGNNSNRTLLVDDVILTGDTQARASLSAGVTVSPNARVMQNTPNVKYNIGVTNDALPTGTAATEGLNYLLSLSGATGFSIDSPTTGTNLAPGPGATHFVSVDTSSTGIKSGTLTVSSNNAWRTNGTVSATSTSPTIDSVAVVAKRVVTASVVDFGTVITGASVSGNSNLATTGSDSERTRITLASGITGIDGNGIALTAASGNLFDAAIDVGTRTLAGNIVGNGVVTGNFDLDVTGEGLAGEDPYADFSVAYTAIVLAHSDAAFSNVFGDAVSLLANNDNELTLDFGTIVEDSGNLSALFDVFAKNVAALVSDLELDAVTGGPTQGPFTLSGNTSFTGLAANNSQTFQVNFDTSTPGDFTATWLFHLSDEDLLGASAEQSETLTLYVRGTIELNVPIVPEPSSLVLLGLGCAALVRMRRRSA